MPFRQILAVSVAVAASAVGLTPAIAAAPGGRVTVTVFLRSPDAAALATLASSPARGRAARVAAVRRVLPSEASHSQVRTALQRRGLRVVDETSWTLTVTGPTAAVTQAFGPVSTSGVAPLSHLPAGLSAAVSSAFVTTGQRPVFRHHDATPLDGTDFRNAYTSPGVQPPVGTAGTAATVATLQLSDWNPDDLTQYAAAHHLPDPIANHTYRSVAVDGGNTDSSGDVEVDLDQESLLSTAPNVRQQAYFAPNSAAGYADVFAHVLDDVTGSSRATAPNPNIVALSTSWGACESGTGAAAIRTLEPVIASLVAAGVTVFASAGDTGIYDCGDPTGTGFGNTQADVDYPASSPHVVGVGGTNLQHTSTPSAPNDGSNWQESTWSCSDSFSCQSSFPPVEGAPGGTGGSGGGVSGSAYDSGTSDAFAGFAVPAYQAVTVQDAPFQGQPKRMVPDIAADADPDTGFIAYTSDSQYVLQSGSNDVQVGGTSLASPVSAGLLADTLIAVGRTTGVGDIHAALYSAYASGRSGVRRDVTSGTNGSDTDRGSDPSVTAQPGYDTTSGIGGLLWPGLVPFLASKAAPSASASLALPDLRASSSTTRVRALWSGRTTTATSLAVQSVTVTISRSGSSTPVYRTTTGPSGSFYFTGAPGATYTMTARATDLGGHTSAAVTRTISVPVDDRRFSFHGAWSRAPGTAEVGASHARTDRRGAYATVSATGRSFALRTVFGSTCGYLTIYDGHRLVKTVNLYSSRKRIGTVTFLGGASSRRAKHTFTFRYTGRKAARSHGRTVNLDALLVTY